MASVGSGDPSSGLLTGLNQPRIHGTDNHVVAYGSTLIGVLRVLWVVAWVLVSAAFVLTGSDQWTLWACLALAGVLNGSWYISQWVLSPHVRADVTGLQVGVFRVWTVPWEAVSGFELVEPASGQTHQRELAVVLREGTRVGVTLRVGRKLGSGPSHFKELATRLASVSRLDGYGPVAIWERPPGIGFEPVPDNVPPPRPLPEGLENFAIPAVPAWWVSLRTPRTRDRGDRISTGVSIGARDGTSYLEAVCMYAVIYASAGLSGPAGRLLANDSPGPRTVGFFLAVLPLLTAGLMVVLYWRIPTIAARRRGIRVGRFTRDWIGWEQVSHLETASPWTGLLAGAMTVVTHDGERHVSQLRWPTPREWRNYRMQWRQRTDLPLDIVRAAEIEIAATGRLLAEFPTRFGLPAVPLHDEAWFTAQAEAARPPATPI